MGERSRHGGRTARNDPIYFFVPDEKVDIVCLAAYLKQFLDASATIKPSRHPREPDRLGYTVGAGSALSKEGLEDVINDSGDWESEKSTSGFKRDPYDYQESDTWQDRLDNGPTPSERPAVAKRRDRKDREERRYDSNNPKTYSTLSGSTESTNQSSIFSRDARSTLSDDTVDPDDSASQYDRHGAGPRPKGPHPKPGPNQPDPNAYNRERTTADSLNVRGLSISDPRPNQGAQRHAKGDDNKSGNRTNIKGGGQGQGKSVYDPWH